MAHKQEYVGALRKFYEGLHGRGITTENDRARSGLKPIGQAHELRLDVNHFGNLHLPLPPFYYIAMA